MSLIRSAIFDVDSTLFDYRGFIIPDSTVDAIRKLKENEVTVVVATSRSYPELSEDLLCKIAADYYVVASGHSIQDASGRVLNSVRFTYEQVELITKLAVKYDAGLTLKYDNYNCLYTHPFEMQQIFSNIGQPRCPSVYCTARNRHKEELPIGFTIRGEGDVREQICQQLLRYPNDFRLELFRNGLVADIYSPSVNKMTGLTQLMNRLGINAENCIAFGDGKNDVEMIQWAGIGVAMGNACEELKAVSDVVCGATWEDGIYSYLESINLI